MTMQLHDLVQGSPEWHAWRANYLMASDAPAMMGVSPYKSRDALLQEKKFGINQEVNEFVQRRFDDGHRFEALARPYAEKFIGAELYPICGSRSIYGASLDGLTMEQSINWEHKTINEAIRAANTAADLPMVYHIQVAHQFLVSGADRTLFSATRFDDEGALLEEKHLWIEPNPELIESIKAGWKQFQADLECYVKPEDAPVIVGKAPDELPALRIEATGMVTYSNLSEFAERAVSVFKGIKTDLVTDEDFADADKTAKWCSDVETRIDLTKQQVLSQTSSLDDVLRAMDSIKAEARQTRLTLEKLVKNKKDSIKADLINDAQTSLQDHIAAINKSLGGNWMPKINGNFAEAAKNKRTIESLRSAVNDALAGAKRDAALIHTTIAENRAAVGDDTHLFPDFVAVCTTKPEIFASLVESRRLAAEAKANAVPAKPTAQAAAQSSVVTPVVVAVTSAANDIPTEFGGNVDPVIQAEGVVAAFLKSREWKNDAERNHARAICIELLKFQSGYREAA